MPFDLNFIDFESFLARFKHLEIESQKVIFMQIERDLRNRVITDPKQGNSKALGRGLFELRIQQDPALLVRIFWAYGGGDEIVILDGYDKKRDSSAMTQNRQILRARVKLDAFRNGDYSK